MKKTKSNKKKIGSAGRRGSSVRSDCFIEVTLLSTGGISIHLTSKVDSLYGTSIRKQVSEYLKRCGVRHASVEIEDQGAVPFVIAARLETALVRAGLRPAEIGFPVPKKKISVPDKHRMRRTRLYLPGNEPHYFLNAALHRPDAVILDLEDSVSPSEKDSARIMVKHALQQVNFGSAERMVRINQLPMGLEDLRTLDLDLIHTILIPKCETAEQIKEIDETVNAICAEQGIKRRNLLLPIIESALGVQNAFAIATACGWICGLSIGLEDYTADIGVERTVSGKESLFARCAVINAAKAAGVQALDSVFSDVNDDAGLLESVVEAKSLGFEGKGCIHPRQIRLIHQGFAPSQREVEYARRVVDAFREAQRNGSGVTVLGSKMIDAPVVKRAHHILSLKNHS
ncbi:MAG: citrate lyase ACP [Bacteroidetes bacterium]|nr:citrate lyase ACP [Bacteroidota bacterium]